MHLLSAFIVFCMFNFWVVSLSASCLVLDLPLIMLDLALYLLSASLTSVFVVLYIYILNFFGYIFYFSELNLVGSALDLVD